MSDISLFLLGMPRIEYKGETAKIARRKVLALAAYLAQTKQAQSRDVIASLLWPDVDDVHARSALRSTLRAATAAIPVEWIQADRMTVRLKQDAVWVDTNVFEKLLAQTSLHQHNPDLTCSECVPLYEQAVELYQADFMLGYFAGGSAEYDDWQRTQREWLHREYADIHRRLSLYYADMQLYARAINHARAWLSVDPLHEPAHRQLMRLFAESGQRLDALSQYKQCVSILDLELASPPENETTQLYEAIQNNQLAVATPVDRSASPGILPRLPSIVIGREAVLEDMKRRLGVGGGEARPITVIQGWPGVGKSTIVALIAHDAEIAHQYPDGVLWASLGEDPDISGEISAWTDALKLGEADRTRKVEDMSAQITAALRDRRILLIVDDVWQAQHAAPFLVGGQFCALIMTSRLNDVASALAPTADDIYRIPVLAEAAGLELLGKLTPGTVAEHPDEARELVRDLEGLPLAIHVAGRLLHNEASMGWGVRELLAELRTGAGLLKAQVPSDMLGVGRETSPTVAALLKRSTDLLDAETRHRFAYLGLFVPKPATFDLEAMGVAWDVDDPKPIARRLVNRGLVEPVSGGRFQMHALLVLHARSLLEEEGNM